WRTIRQERPIVDGHAIGCKEQIKLFTGGYVNNLNERFLSIKGSEKNHFVKAGYVCPFLKKNDRFTSIELKIWM
ncbi:hypothetical protein, partial [Heyndrickxia coagulans]